MIFATAGTTMPFDELFAELDRLAGAGAFGMEKLVCQTGQSTYRVQHGESFRARDTLADLIGSATLVVTHGGATVIQCLLAQRPFVAVPNPRGAGDHQTHFLRQIATVCEISWTSDLSALGALITDRLARGPAAAATGIPRAAELIRAALG